MIGYLVEVLALLVLSALGWRTWRAGAGAAAHRAIGAGLAMTAALVVAAAGEALIAWRLANPLARFGLPVGLAMATFALVRLWGRRDAGRRAAWSAVLAQRPIAARATLITVLAAYAGLALLLGAVAANLIVRRWPAADPHLRERTAVIRHLLLGVPTAVAADPVRLAMERQRQLTGGLGQLFATGRDAVGDATGMSAALEAIDVLREIGDLEHGPKLWLVRNQPALARLIDHRGLRAVASDAAVLHEVERVANGSLAAAWRLGERADIQALFADPEISAALAAIRLADLRAAWRARAADGVPVPIAWRFRVGEPVAPWTDVPLGLESFACGSTGTMSARGTLPGEDVARYALIITGLEIPQVLVAARPCTLSAVPGGWSADIPQEIAGDDREIRVESTAPAAGRFGLALSRLSAQ